MTTPTKTTQQFNVAAHYDVMQQLDAEVHDDLALAETEVNLCIQLLGSIPRSLFLPCFGTGRHIEPLLRHGVQRIVGIDLSPACVQKAQENFGNDRRVTLLVADLEHWRTAELFDASLMLGNSFGDTVDPETLMRVSRGTVLPLKPGGQFIMDYISTGYLDRCRAGLSTTWHSTLYGRDVLDTRTPRFDPATSVMTIDVLVASKETGENLWGGAYQKLIMANEKLHAHFLTAGVDLSPAGTATELNTAYYSSDRCSLGMLAASTWYIGKPLQ